MRTKPSQKNTYDELEKLLMSINTRDCVIILGDFNSRLARNIDGQVGKWSIHQYSDKGGKRLQMSDYIASLSCVSNCFKPRKNHPNPTYMNIQPEKPPRQIS